MDFDDLVRHHARRQADLLGAVGYPSAAEQTRHVADELEHEQQHPNQESESE